ncbi:dimerization domain-containing protein [Streptoalloteichus tenebrarius]|uniref:Dimerization domain-containing protein n=1 Tax=Streptoalloteichus tenebrarius (strain ATCC 17920 / DSM 40477 / JCM 4838 / CBS 697.72 / NBRC 16177 / NCIMB 11028 / NRRL B-12390 / A12253. 1 / ISP 5477) TaxID=1933 RepID=A0ABT1HQM1_STRSD|nr:acetylserotonin O-methyltransferase [Streptoalloteichus tenebrarius]MCP2257816.1 dimerization domain-containing protein [Streptoalloteichus tenebrarius]BFE99819.1 methyltransferase [Streptoalloteichus tenebrarius]
MSAHADLTLDDLTPILFGHAAFQCLNAGCELGLFPLLQREPHLSREEVRDRLGLADRAVDILLLGTTSLRLTRRVDGRYRNAPVIDQLFRDGQWEIFANVVAFEAHIVYEGQADFVASLRDNTNVGLRRIRGTGRDLYHRFAENPHLERVFYRYMRSWSELANPALLKEVDFGGVKKVLDVGGGDGVNAIALAQAHPHLEVTVLEIPATGPITRRRVADSGLSERITVHECDMFRDPFPTGADCVLFSHQLVIWDPERNVELLRRAHAALPPGGQVVIFSSISDDDGDGPLMAALDSVYFAALPAEGGMIYAWRQYEEWLRAAGFARSRRVPCASWTPHGILVATR